MMTEDSERSFGDELERLGKRIIRLRAKPFRTAAAGRGTLRLTADAPGRRRIVAALAEQRVRVEIVLTYEDELGNRKTLRPVVRLKG